MKDILKQLQQHIDTNIQKFVLQKNNQDFRDQIESSIIDCVNQINIGKKTKFIKIDNFTHTEDSIFFDTHVLNHKSAEAKNSKLLKSVIHLNKQSNKT